MPKRRIFAVAGYPVLHSRSPFLFNSLFKTLNIDASYTRISASCAKDALNTARDLGINGMNVTSPLKEEMVGLMDSFDHHSRAINAVNTIVRKNNKWAGYNTDYRGVIRALRSNGVSIKGHQILILGAGGAASAAAYGMKISHPKKITIANRNVKRAQSVAERLDCEYTSLDRIGELLEESDILISCIPKPFSVNTGKSIGNNLIVLDANYKCAFPTKRQRKDQTGLRFIGGLDWLFFQALPAFPILTGNKVPKAFKEELRNKLNAMEITNKAHIALIGFMGAGKTTVGRILADELGKEFIDTDLTIEEFSKQSIPNIFKQKGEKKFREMETSLVEQTFQDSRQKVVSLGGGAVMNEKIQALIRQNCLVIWLWVSVREALKRIDNHTRPLLYSSSPEKKAEILLAERKPFYARASDLVINSEIRTPQEIVRRIKYEMDQTFGN